MVLPALRPSALRRARVLGLPAVAAGLLALGVRPAVAQSAPAPAAPPVSAADPKDKFANLALNTGALGSQKVLVLPMGAVLVAAGAIRDTADDRRWRHPVRGPLAADSALERALALRAPEVQWVMPDEARRLAKRAAGLVPPAERLGQVMLLRNGNKTLPDPLRAHLRTLATMGGGRYALIPGGLVFRADSSGQVKAMLTLVAGDPRTGDVLFRTNAYGRGATADAALQSALDATLPPEPTVP